LSEHIYLVRLLGVLQGYFKPEKPLKVVATLKNLWRTPKGCKYMPTGEPSFLRVYKQRLRHSIGQTALMWLLHRVSAIRGKDHFKWRMSDIIYLLHWCRTVSEIEIWKTIRCLSHVSISKSVIGRFRYMYRCGTHPSNRCRASIDIRQWTKCLFWATKQCNYACSLSRGLLIFWSRILITPGTGCHWLHHRAILPPHPRKIGDHSDAPEFPMQICYRKV
jgi:hypothetical protein